MKLCTSDDILIPYEALNPYLRKSYLFGMTMQDVFEAIDNAYEEGMREGHDSTRQEEYDRGYDQGYDAGYEQAKEEFEDQQ